jgi:hypothetical protein
MRFLVPKIAMRGSIICLLAVSLLGFSACRSDRVSVNPKDPDSPQYAYRLDELALLQMAADDVLEKERKKQYGQIYDEYGSDDFKHGVSRRRFLIMANCVESYLGGLEEFDPNDLGFRRERPKGSRQYLDVLNRKVHRTQGAIEEQLVFVPSGLNFKLNGLYWIAKDKQFLQCIADSPQIEKDTEPKTEATPPEAGTTPDSPEGQSTESSSVESGTQPAETTKTDGTDSTEKLPAPVQEMKPSEIKKAPLQARPAGAGAVIDERPAPKKKKASKEEPAPQAEEPPKPADAPPTETPAPAEPEAPVPTPSDNGSH